MHVNKDNFKISGCEKNKIRIKFKPETRNEINNFGDKNNTPLNINGIKKISKLFNFNNFTDKGLSNTNSDIISERHKKWGFDLWYDVELDENANIDDLIDELMKLNQIDIIEPVYKIELYENSVINETPNDTLLNMMWHLDKINIREAWQISTGNPIVKVGVIDTGAKYDHPDIQGNIGGYESFVPTKPFKAGKHGSHTSGTIGAVTNNQKGISGIAGGNGESDSGVKIFSLQVFYDTTSGGFANAFIWAADNGMAMTSNSWGYITAGVYEQAVIDAIDYFCEYGGGDVLQGGLVICSAGNDNHDLPHYPSAYEKCISVAATNINDRKAFYSNYGDDVDISAPGGEMNMIPTLGILSLDENDNYVWLQGTSMACPHVTGVAALIVSAFPYKFTAEHVREILLLSSDNIDDINSEFIGKLGAGRLNAGNALKLAKEYSGIPEEDLLTLEIIDKNIKINWDIIGDCILAVNTESFFGLPDLNSNAGDYINGGGYILKRGEFNEFVHINPIGGLRYYYKLWYINENGLNGTKIKFVSPQKSDLPYLKLNPNDQEDGWTKEGQSIVSPIIDLSNYESIQLVYRNYATGPAWLKNFKISRDGGITWNILIAPTIVNKWNHVSTTINNLTNEMRFMWFFEDDPNAGTWEILNFGLFNVVGKTLEIINGVSGETNYNGLFNIRENILFPLKAIYDGQRFLNWEISINNITQISSQSKFLLPINDNTIVKANFDRKKLTVSRIGKGLITLDPGIYYYDIGTEINLFAESIDGEVDQFYGWYINSILTKEPSIRIILNNDTKVEAKFEHKVKIITQIVGDGEILTPIPNTEIFNGDYLDISCKPNTNSTFVEWERWVNDKLSEPILTEQDNIRIVATNTVKLIAKFTSVPLNEIKINLIANGEGYTIPDMGENIFQVGKTFKGLARPNSGYVFTYWDSPEYGRLDGSPIYLLPNKDFTLTANFDVKPPPITDPVWLSMVRIGKGHSVPAGLTRVVQRGSTFTYLAVPDVGWKFIKWESNLFGVHTEPEVTFTVTTGSTVGSFFERTEDSALVTILAITGGTTNPTVGEYMFKKGDVITLNAIPNEGYVFEKWNDPYLGAFYSPEITITLERDVRIAAYFSKTNQTQYNLTILTNGNGTVLPFTGTTSFEGGTVITLTAIPL